MSELLSNETQVRIVGTEIPFLNEIMETTDNVIYRIADRTKSVWKTGAAITVSTIAPEDTFEVDWANGYIRFQNPLQRGILTVSGVYLTTTIIGKVLAYSLENARDFTDVHFVGALEKENIPLGLSVSGNIETLEIEDSYFLDAFENAEELLLEFIFGSITKRALVYVEKYSTNHSGGGLVKNNITFRSAKE